jgi:hypothetical protein
LRTRVANIDGAVKTGLANADGNADIGGGKDCRGGKGKGRCAENTFHGGILLHGILGLTYKVLNGLHANHLESGQFLSGFAGAEKTTLKKRCW